MSVSGDYIEFVRDLLGEFEPLRIKRMFGGAGVYSGEFFFAILADDTLFLKANEDNRADFEQRGLHPFSYETKTGRTVTMSYYPVPVEAMEGSRGACSLGTRSTCCGGGTGCGQKG